MSVLLDGQARMYSLWLFFILLALLVASDISADFHSDPERLRLSRWLALAVFLSLAFWTHALTLYVWLALGFSLLFSAVWPRRIPGHHRRPVLMAMVGTATLIVLLSAPGLVRLARIAEANAVPTS